MKLTDEEIEVFGLSNESEDSERPIREKFCWMRNQVFKIFKGIFELKGFLNVIRLILGKVVSQFFTMSHASYLQGFRKPETYLGFSAFATRPPTIAPQR